MTSYRWHKDDVTHQKHGYLTLESGGTYGTAYRDPKDDKVYFTIYYEGSQEDNRKAIAEAARRLGTVSSKVVIIRK